MNKLLRPLFLFALPVLVLAACGTDPDSASPVDTTLDLAAVANDCPAGDISQAISEIFPTKKSLRHVATVHCGQIFKDFGKGKQRQAIQKAFKFFEKTLQQNEAEQLLDPDPSVEAKVGELFTAIFAGIGFDLPAIDPSVLADGEYAFGELIPNGAPLITVSGHAGIDDGGGLFGPVSVFIVKIPAGEGEITGNLALSSDSHPCPDGVDNDFDCYPLFFDYSVVPESNVNPAVGLQLGQCNVSPGGVEVLLLSPEGFLPEDDAPTGVVCGDVEAEEVTMTGWRSYAWAVLEPISPIFRVTPAIAGKNPIGGRISAFSPVAPADPTSGGEEGIGSIAGQITDNSTESLIQGATVELFTSDEALVAGTTTNSDGNYFFSELDLGDYQVKASAEGYEPGSSAPFTLTEESPDVENADIGLDPGNSQVNGSIAFSSERDGIVEIYVMNADGTGQTRLTNNGQFNGHPAWSSDGTKIAFTSIRDDHFYEIYVMNADGSGQTQLTNTNGAISDHPAWSPDGTKIAFSRSVANGSYEIYVMNANGSGETQLTNNFTAQDGHPAWSPDGTKIAFSSNQDDGYYEIFVINADGTGQTQLTDTNNVDASEPAWSPDGTKIAFRRFFGDFSYEIYVMNADGTEQTPLTNNTADDASPAWLPDGTKIVFSTDRDGNTEIYVMNADGTAPTNLTNNAAHDSEPAWAP